MKVERSCGGILFRRNNKKIEFLLVKSIGRRGYWGFPKGHMESGETERDTALREIKEETGLSNIKLYENLKITDSYSIKKDNIKEVTFFIGEALSYNVKIQEEEIADYMWGTIESCLDVLTFESIKNILDYSNNLIRKEIITY
ncbi:bis(5'-nucleosyl)-tetraphosphatase [Clostridium senegalense]|uniref:bis(5'-nucleosyl)-tetraphosphatase n=1 Tax=Clostridium senegalense TaxID=1465809 RepID=UPI000289D96A|nr:NUDIX domain-containing protein [Clostridium senegalense]